MMERLGGVLIGLVVLYVIATLIGAVVIGGLKDRARRAHERRHAADRIPPRFGM